MKETLAETFVEIKYQQKVLMYLSMGNFDQFSFRIVKNYYPQVFLEEWQKKKKKIYLQKTRKKEKEKRCLNILLMIQKLLLINLIKKILVKKAIFDKTIIKLKKFSLRPVWLNS